MSKLFQCMYMTKKKPKLFDGAASAKSCVYLLLLQPKTPFADTLQFWKLLHANSSETCQCNHAWLGKADLCGFLFIYMFGSIRMEATQQRQGNQMNPSVQKSSSMPEVGKHQRNKQHFFQEEYPYME